MIPKIIHYCWFGRKPLPPLAIKCIESWRNFLPDYEIKEWNEDNFDVNSIRYTCEAYAAKKYAFVSDYARFWILYHYGGLYFDTDVEVIKPMDDIIIRGPFMGCETVGQQNGMRISTILPGLGVNPGLGLGANPGLGLYAEMLDLYSNLSFYKEDGSYNHKTVVAYTTEVLYKHGLQSVNDIQQCAGIWIYPKAYFCPYDYKKKEMNITENSYTIHHYMASWHTRGQKIYAKLRKVVGDEYAAKLQKFLRKYKMIR